MAHAFGRLAGIATLGLATGAAPTPALAVQQVPARQQPTPAAPSPAKPSDAPAPPSPESRPARRPALQPPTPAEPQPARPKVRVSARRGQVLPEGTFLVSRRGRLVPADDRSARERWTFRFDPDASGAAEAPMVLLRCEKLEAMTNVARDRAGAIDFLVSGQVFVYRGQNYMLPLHAEATTAPVPPPPSVGPPVEAADDAPATDAAPARPSLAATPEDEAQRRIRELERNTRERPRLPMPAPATDASAPAPAPHVRAAPVRGGLVSEGTYLASRRARLVREGDGEWVLRFDADAAGEVDPPMLVQPCANLEAMQRITASLGDAATFTVSGQVFSYRGRNYVLPGLFSVETSNPDLIPGR